MREDQVEEVSWDAIRLAFVAAVFADMAACLACCALRVAASREVFREDSASRGSLRRDVMEWMMER